MDQFHNFRCSRHTHMPWVLYFDDSIEQVLLFGTRNVGALSFTKQTQLFFIPQLGF